MNKKIMVLDPQISNKIAAGEVVEKPASVIKELIENSIDAGSSNITVEIKNGGKDYIRISDDGTGINHDDILIAFMRHATSKISTLNDIYNINSLGFRGEALASISAVSNVELVSKTESSELGKKIVISGGSVLKNENIGAQTGTTIIIKDLFFNTPARLKFLKTNTAEQNAISNLVNKLAVSNLDISFKYIINDEIIFKTRGNGNLRDIVYDIFGSTIPKNMIDYSGESLEASVNGLISPLEFTRGNRKLQITYVNGRYVNSSVINDSISLAYKGFLPINRFPVCFIFLTVPSSTIDVNIHPSKTEIKFHEEGKIKQLIYSSIRRALNEINQIPKHTFEKAKTFDSEDFKMKDFKESEPVSPISSHSQINFTSQSSSQFPEKSISEKSFSNLKYDLNDLFMKDIGETVVKEEEEIERIAEGASVYDDLKYVGQVFKSYLIFEKNDNMYLLDQHAAHEKILYEEFMKSYRKEKINSQILLEPIIIDLPYNDKNFILSKLSELNKSGFLIEGFGNNSIIIREIPYIFDISASKAFIEDYISNFSEKSSVFEFKEDSIIMESCKAAIKANMRISDIEVNDLLDGLKTLENPYTCPHGRPIIVEIMKYEIERKFKRK